MPGPLGSLDVDSRNVSHCQSGVCRDQPSAESQPSSAHTGSTAPLHWPIGLHLQVLGGPVCSPHPCLNFSPSPPCCQELSLIKANSLPLPGLPLSSLLPSPSQEPKPPRTTSLFLRKAVRVWTSISHLRIVKTYREGNDVVQGKTF